MRIRKNGSFPIETFQAHVCHLNQSPWDVIHQFEDGLKNGDSFVALGESVASMMETEAEGVVDIDNRPAIENFDMMVLDDNQKKKVVNNNSGGNKGLKRNLNGGDIEAVPQRGRGRPKKASGSGSSLNNNNNSNEFFGPLWGKQRKGGKYEDEDNKGAITLATSGDDKVNVGVDVNVAPCYSEGLDYVENYEDDDYNGKRRVRNQ